MHRIKPKSVNASKCITPSLRGNRTLHSSPVSYRMRTSVVFSSPFFKFCCGPKNFLGTMPTMDRSRQTVSVGCAPTPIQYCARSRSSRISLCRAPESSYGSGFGTGSYVPMTSSGLEFRAVLVGKVSDEPKGREHTWEWRRLPCVRDDNVIKWGVAAPEAREAHLDNHGRSEVVVMDLCGVANKMAKW
jgi:hypothetical protein